MKWLLRKLGHGLASVTEYLIAFGPFGLFAIALLDSALIPLPGGADAVLFILAAARPAWWPLYVAAATLGSVGGCVVLYYLSRRAGGAALKRFSADKQARVKALLDRYDILSVLVASILPPPFPFKLFVVSAGVFRLSVVRFALAVAGGRLFRFALEGYLAAHYGARAKDLLAKYYPIVGLSLAALLVAAFLGKNWLKSRRRVEAEG